MMQEAPVAKATSPDYCKELQAETRRIRQALRALNHNYVTRLNGTARRVAEAVITAYAFPTVYGPHYHDVLPTKVAVNQSEFMLSTRDRNRFNACDLGINNALLALRAADKTRTR